MPKSWQHHLQRWTDAGLIDPDAAERIRALEMERDQRSGHRWPVLLAWIFGGLMLCAGVLLFVAAPDAGDSETVTRVGFISLGPLKGNIGDQNYNIPTEADLDRYRAVTIWGRRFGANFGTAPLELL